MTPRTILLVDDDVEILMLYRLALKRKSDWNIFSATDGPTALKQAAQCHPDIVVLDVMLPGEMTGVDICQRLRSQPDTAHVLVVMLSALSDRTIHQAAFAAGAHEFWHKPVPLSEFSMRLETIMAKADATLDVFSG